MTPFQRSPLQYVRESRSWLIEVSIGLLAILLLPLILRNTGSVTNVLFFVLGFNDLLGQLTGERGQTDIGWEVAASAGLVDRQVSAYAPLGQLGPLIGMNTVENVPHIHPPPALTIFVPLAFFSYTTWLGSWVIAMVLALAWTLRIMSVPVWVAYPIAVGLSLTRVGQVSLTTTYPLLALSIALAWRYRSGTWLPGLALTLITASRGFGGILLLYPLLRRQIKTLLIVAGSLLALTIVAVLLEPRVVIGFLTDARASIEYTMTRPMTTPNALAEYVGIPGVTASVSALLVAMVSLWRNASLFWVLNWLSFALMPIRWAHSALMLIPLATVIWRSSRFGALLMAIPIISMTAFTLGIVMVWPIGIAATGVGLIVRPPHDPDDPLVEWRQRRQARKLLIASD